MRHRYAQQTQLFDFREGVGGSGAPVSRAVAHWNSRQRTQHQYTPALTHFDKAVEILQLWIGPQQAGSVTTLGRSTLPLPYESPAELLGDHRGLRQQYMSLNKDDESASGRDEQSPRESLTSDAGTPADRANHDVYDRRGGADDDEQEVPPTSFSNPPFAIENGGYARQLDVAQRREEEVAEAVPEKAILPRELLRLAVAENVMQHLPTPNRNYPDVIPKSHRQLKWDIQHGQASLHSYSGKITALPSPQVMAERLAMQQKRRIVSHAELKRAVASHRVGVDF